MKKLLVFALTFVMLCTSLVACGAPKSSSAKTVKVIEINLTEEEYAFGVDKTQPELLAKTNEFIAQIMEDGTFDAITRNAAA